MTTLPKLTTATDFKIEGVTRKPDDTVAAFVVTLKLADGELRSIVVGHRVLLDYSAFREAALAGANLLLRHAAEYRAFNSRYYWLESVSEGILRSATAQQQQPKQG